MAITDLWATFFQWFPWPSLSSGVLKARPEFDFLADFPAYSPPAKLPVLSGLGKLTPIPDRELTGIHHHEGTEKIWSCISPCLPVQVVPEIGLECRNRNAKLSRFQLHAYLHPLGLVASLRFRMSLDPGVDGFRLAKLLNDIERDGPVTSRAKQFKRVRTVVQLFNQVRDSVAAQVFVAPPRFGPPKHPAFCVLTLGSDYGQNIDAVKAGLGVELMSALERRTGNRHADPAVLAEQFCVEEGRTSYPNVRSGWALVSINGMAVYIEPGEVAARADRARLCDHRNVVKLLGFYRLYQAFLEDASQTTETIPPGIVGHAVNAMDEMRVKYSRWWIRWGSERLRLERPVKAAVERYGINRVKPPNQKTSVPPSTPNAEPKLHYKVFPLALAAAQPERMDPLISFDLTNRTGVEVGITIDCELKEYGIQTSERVPVPPGGNTVPVDIRFTVKNLGLIPKWTQLDYCAYVELPGGEKRTLLKNHTSILLQPIDYFVFASRNAATRKIRDWSWMIAAWVSGQQPALLPVVQKAREINGGGTPGYAVPGDKPSGVRKQVQALYEALQQVAAITYDDSATVYHLDDREFAQRVRLPHRSLQDGAANCLDGCVLFASLLTSIGLHPMILLLPGHAMVGWKQEDSETSDFEFLETTVLAKKKFAEACQDGMNRYAAVKARADDWKYTGELPDLTGFAIPIDVEKEWRLRQVAPLPWE
ncbi:MAG: hypothetical protein WBL61_18475 [Bryobacteraceae bacterium]